MVVELEGKPFSPADQQVHFAALADATAEFDATEKCYLATADALLQDGHALDGEDIQLLAHCRGARLPADTTPERRRLLKSLLAAEIERLPADCVSQQELLMYAVQHTHTHTRTHTHTHHDACVYILV